MVRQSHAVGAREIRARCRFHPSPPLQSGPEHSRLISLDVSVARLRWIDKAPPDPMEDGRVIR
jgi:hypothetical protein